MADPGIIRNRQKIEATIGNARAVLALREDGEIVLHTKIAGVPHDANLIVRAARKLQAESGCHLGADIWLDKRLPMGGGIGGGSSDAATTLVGLNHLWRLGMSEDRLAELGIDYDEVVNLLEKEGVEKFEASWAELLETVQSALDSSR